MESERWLAGARLENPDISGELFVVIYRHGHPSVASSGANPSLNLAFSKVNFCSSDLALLYIYNDAESTDKICPVITICPPFYGRELHWLLATLVVVTVVHPKTSTSSP